MASIIDQQEYATIADQLERLAAKFRQLQRGTLKPHTKDSEIVGVMTRNVIRLLVSDWL